jgi:hypothetical protein
MVSIHPGNGQAHYLQHTPCRRDFVLLFQFMSMIAVRGGFESQVAIAFRA